MHDSISRLSTALGNRYAFERELGRGGMATVYLARDLKLDRLVAIKVLLEELGTALGPERFRREIALATQLSHPHILPIYDSGEAAGQLYYVMPFVAGETLRDRLDQQRQLGIEEALRITCEIASALEHAHRHNVVHRDIKPENILLEDGQALVADFGIARAVSAIGEQKLTKTGVSLGTPAYMSPEQAMADPALDARTDVYSLGCVLYEMLAGAPPFTGPTAQAIIARHALADVPSLTVARATIPDEVEDAVIRAMAKVPADRFATSAEFAGALRACPTTTRASASRTERRARARPAAGASRYKRHVAAVGVMIGLVAVAGIALAGWPILVGDRQTRTMAGGFEYDLRRIAVLYFEDQSGQADLGALADGLTEGLIDELTQVRALDVVSRNGVSPFRNSAAPLDSVARALQAGMIVRGSVDRLGDRIRVDIRLFEGNTGGQIDRTGIEMPERDLLAIRDSVPARVAQLLRGQLGSEIALRESRAGTVSSRAWLVFQQAERLRKEARRLTAMDSTASAARQVAVADSLLAMAEELDPEWPKPILTRTAVELNRVLSTRDNLLRKERIDTGLAHVARALDLDPRNAEALELRGTLRYLKRYFNLALDPTEAAALLRTAEADLREATRIDPERASAWNTLSLLLYRKFDRLGSYQAAYQAYTADAYLESAKEILWRLYATSYDTENFVNAKQWCDQGNVRYPADPTFASCRLWLMTTNLSRPDPAAAWQAFEAIKQRTPATRWESIRRQHEMLVAVPIARAGLLDSARAVIERARAGRDLDPTGELIGREVLVRTLIGDRETAIDLLRSYLAAFPQHREGFVSGNTWWWRSLQDDSRFKQLVGS